MLHLRVNLVWRDEGMAEEMPSPGTNWEWTSPGTQGLRQEGPALTPEHSMKNHLLQNLAKWLGKLGCASQFELNQSVRNGEINQHNKTSCRQPGGCCGVGSFGTLGSAGAPGGTEGVQYEELWRVAPRNGKY